MFLAGGELVEWRGPAPYWFVRLPVDVADEVKDAARGLEYWGQVAVLARIGDTAFRTALFPREGTYLLPLRDAVRRAVGLAPPVEGTAVTVAFELVAR